MRSCRSSPSSEPHKGPIEALRADVMKLHEMMKVLGGDVQKALLFTGMLQCQLNGIDLYIQDDQYSMVPSFRVDDKLESRLSVLAGMIAEVD